MIGGPAVIDKLHIEAKINLLMEATNKSIFELHYPGLWLVLNRKTRSDFCPFR